jgi:hypothetical protein
MATATTRTGLKLLTTILYNTYQTGRKVAVDFKLNLKIVFDEFLPQWNYTPKPQLQVISSTILTMSWRMQQGGIKQSQGFQVIYILLHSYVYLCLPT